MKILTYTICVIVIAVSAWCYKEHIIAMESSSSAPGSYPPPSSLIGSGATFDKEKQ